MIQKAREVNLCIHCRAGSLENTAARVLALFIIHCRAGSLESWDLIQNLQAPVHCRTGSLEKLTV